MPGPSVQAPARLAGMSRWVPPRPANRRWPAPRQRSGKTSGEESNENLGCDKRAPTRSWFLGEAADRRAVRPIPEETLGPSLYEIGRLDRRSTLATSAIDTSRS